MGKELFRLTEEYALQQYSIIMGVLNQYPDAAMIVYQSNWYIHIACLDWYVASEIRCKLSRKIDWEMDIAPGRKNTVRHYIRIKLLRE